MSSVVIPKEQQTAYQRWEMASFSDGKEAVNGKPKSEMAAQSEKIAQLFDAARKDGYKKGLEEGYQAGMQQAVANLDQEKRHFLKLASAFEDAVKRSDDEISQSLLDLALDIAKAMLKTKLQVDQELILPVVREAIHYLPFVQRPANIIIHPQDAKTLRAFLAEELAEQHWQIIEDESMEPGGCMVETGANQIDASNATRWKRIAEVLSQQGNDWNAA